MPDDDTTMNFDSKRSLGAALRALPTSAPPRDLWPGLARALNPPRRRARMLLPMSFAAAVLLALLWSLPIEHRVSPSATPSAAVVSTSNVSAPMTDSPADRELDRLRARSQMIERWLQATSAQAPHDGRDLMAAAEVEDMVGLVDVQLSATRNDSDALPLWRQRVALLEDLSAIRAAPAALNLGDANRGLASAAATL
ncbi:MAG: hypothetical protein ABI451_06125 [Dokdonella sp.]